MKRLLITLCAVLIGGCAATGPQFADLEEAQADTALVYFIRPSAFTASARKVNIAIDKVVYVRLANAGYTIARLKPGWHEFEQSISYILGGPMRQPSTFGMELKEGETYFIGFHASSAVGMPWVAAKPTTTTNVVIPISFQYGFGIIEKSNALELLRGCRYQEPEK